MSFFFQSVLTRSLHFSVLEISCCSIFNEQFLRSEVALELSARILYLNKTKLSSGFLNFFIIFLYLLYYYKIMKKKLPSNLLTLTGHISFVYHGKENYLHYKR